MPFAKGRKVPPRLPPSRLLRRRPTNDSTYRRRRSILRLLRPRGMGFVFGEWGGPVIFWLLRFFGVYAIVEERTCNVYVLFGKVVAIIDEPGLHILVLKLGLKAPIVRWLGRLYVLDMRIDQQYLRSQPVNSEEGAPMGIGIWYEMFISDPVAFLFKNADPRGSLATNVSNSTVRCLLEMRGFT